MSNKKNNYITEELDWLESKASEIKQFADLHPYHEISDRVVSLLGATGLNEKVSATIESQQKSIRDSLKDYALIIEAINKLREQEENKMEMRGGGTMSLVQEEFLKNRK